ncbi:hypothetical protein [Robbsia andropogonis]|nr:hypothetical protein [Robbsia andropogonis]
MSAINAKRVGVTGEHRDGRHRRARHRTCSMRVAWCAVGIAGLAAIGWSGVPGAIAATWSSTDATTTEAITNAPPQRDTPSATHRARSGNTKTRTLSTQGKSRRAEAGTVTETHTVVTTTLPGTGRSANTVTIGSPQVMLQPTGSPGGGMNAAPCVPLHFAIGSPPQGQSSQVDSWYCPQGQSGNHVAPR